MILNFSESVAASKDDVFRVFTDFENAAARIEGIIKLELLEEGPVGVGTRFRETRVMFGRETTEEMEIVDFDPHTMYAVEADSCGARIRTEFTFRADGDSSTEVCITMETTAMTIFAKLMSPLGWLMAGSMKKMFLADIQQLKLVCEQQAA